MQSPPSGEAHPAKCVAAHAQLKCAAVTVPTKDLAIAESIPPDTASVVCLPGPTSLTTSIIPNKFLIASDVWVFVMREATFASAPGTLPSPVHDGITESHVITSF
jgi:hypothetical protein